MTILASAITKAPRLDLGPASEATTRYATAARSEATKRAYRSAWIRFASWCEIKGTTALPASPEAVAGYLAELADAGRRVATLELHRTAISQAHQLGGFPSPTQSELVRTVIKGVRRSKGAKPRQAAAATADVLYRMIAELPHTRKGRRDRALLLLGFAAALRRSELVALTVGDLQFTREGLIITIRRSKTDQDGTGQEVAVPYQADPHRCPVRSLQAWLEDSAILEGSVFRGVDRHGNVAAKPLSPHAVGLLIKAAAEGAGEDPALFGGHSLRAGLATSAARAGASDHAIMRQGRWRSRAVMDRYQRERDRWRDNAAAAAFQGV